MNKLYLKINIVVLIQFILAVFVMPASAQNFTVTSNGDTHATSPTTSALDGSAQITLRSAMEASTQIAGTHIITIPSSITTINITQGTITVGNGTVGNNITLNGPGKSVLTINQTTVARTFFTGAGAVSFTINDLTINYNGGTASSISGGGGALIAGGSGANTTLNNVDINNFHFQVGNGGGISASSSGVVHNLTLNNCSFSNNYTGGGGGAVSYTGLGTCTITNCTFTGNQTGPIGANTGGSGGAISVSGNGAGGTYSITNCTFTGNQALTAGQAGGAIVNGNGVLTVTFCRFVNNTATNGNSLAQVNGVSANSITANNNWWGANAPGANENYLAPSSGTITCTKWLQLKATAATSSLCATKTTVVTASFLSNSAGETVTTGNISRLIGLPISFSAALGTLSGAQANIQAAGTATVTYTAGSTSGSGSVNAVVDNVPTNDATAKAAISVLLTPTIDASPSPFTACAGLSATFSASASNLTTAAWQESSDAGFTAPTTLSNTGVYSGTGTSTLTISDITGLNGKYYRMVANNSNGCSANSSGALLTVTASTLSGNNTVTHAVNTSNNLYYAASCALIAKAVPSGANALTGNVTAQVWAEASTFKVGGQAFLQRHYQITPGTSPSTATGTVTLYFYQSEFNDFNANAASTLDLPANPTDATGKSHLLIAKYAGSSSDGTGRPGSYPAGSGVIIDPIDANIVWNATFGRWEVTVDVTGFSGFLVQTFASIVPVNLISFTGQRNSNTSNLKWVIAQPVNKAVYDLQRSTSAIDFVNINTQQGNNFSTVFSYADEKLSGSKYYYRLKITDENGKISYSNIISLDLGKDEDVTIYPNPIKKGDAIQLTLNNISANGVQIINYSGQVVYTAGQKINGTYNISLPAFANAGLYFIKVFSDDRVIIKKIMIQ